MSDSSLHSASPPNSDQESFERLPAALAPQPFDLDDLTESQTFDAPPHADFIGSVNLDLRIELGRTSMRLEDVLQLRTGSVVTLDDGADEPVNVYVNDRLIARGEVLVMNERFCIRITELISS